jgi:hypothetical protein
VRANHRHSEGGDERHPRAVSRRRGHPASRRRRGPRRGRAADRVGASLDRRCPVRVVAPRVHVAPTDDGGHRCLCRTDRDRLPHRGVGHDRVHLRRGPARGPGAHAIRRPAGLGPGIGARLRLRLVPRRAPVVRDQPDAPFGTGPRRRLDRGLRPTADVRTRTGRDPCGVIAPRDTARPARRPWAR